jgi:hypothetical protein
MSRAPSRADVKEKLLLWYAAFFTLRMGLTAALRRVAGLDDHAPKLGDAGQLAVLCRCVTVKIFSVTQRLGLQLVQELS